MKFRRIVSFILLLLVSITLSLPKEFFDPHIGIDDDIFCKSLYAIGYELECPIQIIFGQVTFYSVFLALYCLERFTVSFYSTFNRAPPHSRILFNNSKI